MKGSNSSLTYGFVVLVGGLLYWFSQQGKKFVKNLSLKTVKVHQISFDFQKTLEAAFTTLFFKVKLNIENPTEAGATASNVVVVVYYNGKPFAGINTPSEIKFDPKSNKIIGVNLRVPTLNAVTSVIEIVNKLRSKTPFDVEVKGYVEMLGGKINFAEKKTVAL